MAIKRKEVNETDVQKHERLTKESIANHATRSEKTAWARKQQNLEKLIHEQVRPIEEQILDLQLKLRPMYDQIQSMRQEMVESCVHPYEMLVTHDDAVTCKFCGKTLSKLR